jgi:hypothetical protein
MNEAHQLVAAVREAAARHSLTWGELIPASLVVNPAAELAEEQAYAEMAAAKQALRDHICAEYGITAAELCALTR